MRLTFLGTGTSFGVPQIGCDCAVCRSTDPRDKRSRSGALVEADGSTILIDTPPELRLQLIAGGIAQVDAVLYTHEHADHTNGIDDLRMFSVRRRRALPIYGPPETLERLRTSFSYIFDDVRPYEGTSKPSLELHAIEPDRPVDVAGVRVLPLAFRHGHLRVYGYRIGGLAYVTDVKAIPEAERRQMQGLDVLVLNALWWRPHPTHLSISEAIETARSLGARRTYLTHLTHETGHAELAAQLPDGVFPAYDGLTVEVP
ncbi:MAG TPA: MBL fold metallo-hydrolase [Gemmatimonadales bacterium]|jgi:phosphoribosyl 1,2-cyclic phosphate phosphodiesterase|nr:MBL fold metallo-hydrolase [Gemmatimonadales bacterium]